MECDIHMKKFIITWKKGKGTEIVEGNGFITALREAGYDSMVIHSVEKWEEYKMISVSIINTIRNGYDVTVYNEKDQAMKRLSKSGMSEYGAESYLEELKEKYEVDFVERQSIVNG